jgi:hypothetical protein
MVKAKIHSFAWDEASVSTIRPFHHPAREKKEANCAKAKVFWYSILVKVDDLRVAVKPSRLHL